MAKLPNLRKIFSSDFKSEYKDLMEQVGILFNGGLEPLYNALNNKLTIRDNFSSTIAQFTVAVDSTGTPRQQTVFKLSTNQTVVEGIFVIYAAGSNDSTILPASSVFVSWTHASGTITVNNVIGLTPDISYNVKVVVLG